MSSLEFTPCQVRRTGPIELAWHWRWELGTLIVTVGLSAVIAASLGVVWFAAAAGAGLAAVGALLRWPPARCRSSRGPPSENQPYSAGPGDGSLWTPWLWTPWHGGRPVPHIPPRGRARAD